MTLLHVLAGAALFGCTLASVAANDDAGGVARSLAPSGRLRAAINFGNPVLAQRGANGEPRGVSVDLARELARRLGVPVDFVTFDAAGKVTDALRSDAWDVAFLARDPSRAESIAFSAPYVVIEGTYLVRSDDARFQRVEDLDRDGVRIAVARGSAYDLFLTRSVAHAELVRYPSGVDAMNAFPRTGLDAVAGVKQALATSAQSRSDVRLVPGRFMQIEQAVAIPRAHESAAASAYVQAFVEEMKRSGFVARALAASGQTEATVAPPAP